MYIKVGEGEQSVVKRWCSHGPVNSNWVKREPEFVNKMKEFNNPDTMSEMSPLKSTV